MSAKDTKKAAEALQNLFGPIMTALPAIIAQASDEESAEKRLKQLEIEYNRLVDKYNKQLDAFGTAEKKHDEAMEARRKHFAELEATGAAALKDLAAKQREASRKLGEKNRAVDAANAEASATIAKVQAEMSQNLSAMEAQAKARLAELETQIAEMDAKYEATLAKINKLKSSLA